MSTDLPAHRLQSVNRAIRRMRALDLAAVTIEDIAGALEALFEGYQIAIPRFVPGVRFYRGRVCAQPQKIADLSYPPADRTPLGRANRAGRPLLYCCTSREATFFECRPRAGDTLALGRWVTTNSFTANFVGYSDSVFRRLASNRPIAAWNPESPPPAPNGEADRLISEFLADAFSPEVPPASTDTYKLSIAIAERLINGTMIDGLLFPTVRMRANADNVAVKTTYADQNLRLERAEFVRVNSVSHDSFNVTVVDSAVDVAPDGTIDWRGRPGAWTLARQGDRLTVTAEAGRWVARDEAGRIVDPD